jgi:myo-inositol 2-dehydrogenase/D-chiro-inositol 1-dehydrogenase
MGRTAAYTGQVVTWDEMMKSGMDLGPAKIEFGPVDMVFEVPVPGTAVNI